MSSNAKRICLENREPAVVLETTVEKLCDDVLVEIFSYLSARDMKSAALVCQNWNEVIGSAAVTMKKIKLVIGRKIPDEAICSVTERLEDFKKFCLAMELTQPGSFGSTRKHQNIEIKEFPGVMQVSERFDLSQAKSFKFDHFHNLANISWLLSLTPLLEKLIIGNRFAFSTQGSKVDLPKLKKMFVRSNDAVIYDLITCGNLVELDHQPERVFVYETNQRLLAHFLGRCKKLETLRLGSRALEAFLEAFNSRSTGWNLSTFEVYFKRFPDEAFVTNLENFLISQAKTLTTLQFKKYINENLSLPTEFFKKIFSKATKLTKFRNTCDREFFDNHGDSLRRLSALEELYTRANVHDLNSIARFHPKLSFLVVESVTNSLDSGLKFNNLKRLGVAFLGDVDVGAWISLIKNCPTIETFEFQHFSHHVGKDLEDYLIVIKALLHHPTIRHLLFHSDDVRQLETLFMKVAKNYGNLTCLTLHKEIDPPKTIDFLLPEDPTLWNFVEQSQRFRRFISVQFPAVFYRST